MKKKLLKQASVIAIVFLLVGISSLFATSRPPQEAHIIVRKFNDLNDSGTRWWGRVAC